MMRNRSWLLFSLVSAGALALGACADDTTDPASDTGVDAGSDGSGDGDVSSDTTVDPDGTGTDTVDTPDGADVQNDTDDDTQSDADAAPTDGSTEGDTETDGSAVPAECGDGVIEGEELCDDDNDDETDGCLSDCRTTTEISGEVVMDEFAVAGVAITATLGDEVLTTTSSEDDGTFTLYLPAGEWTLEAALSTFVIVSDDATYTSEGSGTDEIEFTVLTSTVAIAPDAYGTSSPDEPSDLPSEDAIQFRTFDVDGDGDWFVIDTEETGEIALFTINLGAQTDTRFSVYDAAEFVAGENNDDLTQDGFGFGNEDDDVYLDSLVILPLDDSDVTEYIVHLRHYDHPCGIGSYMLGAASGDLLLDADDDNYIALKDCDDDNEDVNPGAEELSTTGVDDNCDGFNSPAEPVDFGIDNSTRETAYALTLNDPYFSFEPNIIEDRFAELALDTLVGPGEHWFSVTVAPYGVVDFDDADLVNDCSWSGSFYWDDEIEEAGSEGPGDYYNDTDAARTLYMLVDSDMSAADGETPAEWCVFAPFVYDYGTDVDGDGFASNGWGDARDIDDADENVESCEVENEL